jgi:hypothetical protein
MRLLIAVLLTLPLAAQEASTQQAQPAAAEPRLSLEVGNRWGTEVKGNSDVYRSLVNLGDGPKVLGLDLSLRGPASGLFDKLDVRGDGWGGEPYSTARVSAQRDNAYRLSVDYRNLAYFNALPSFANPGIDRGVLASQRTYNLRRRMLDTQLDLFPNRRVIPYLAYSRDWGSGDGVTDFVADANEYAVRNIFLDKTDHYRGGVRFQFNRFHATLEQGGTAFKDDQRLYMPPGTYSGNRTSPLLGQNLVLSTLNQAYRARGTSKYSKVLVTANPFSWVDLSGQFLYSLPSSDVNLSQDNTGNFFSANSFAFFTSERLLASTQAKQPHTSGSFGAEIRPHRRIRVLESFMTDRFHTTSNLVSLVDALTPGGSTTQAAGGFERLVFNYNRQELNVLFDVGRGLTFRGGHRYVWGDAVTRAPGLSQTGPQRSSEMKMQVGLAGLSFRPVSRLSVHFDFEGASADKNYFRTSLQDYHKLQTRARYQVLNSLALAFTHSHLRNENPSPASRYDFESQNSSLTAYWTPWGGKWISLTGDYTRSTLSSDISYLVPQTFRPERSFYEERAHVATSVLDVKLPRVGPGSPAVSLGGSLYVGTGSRATDFYQPFGRLSVPLHRKASVFGEWRWYKYGERLYLYEGFRTHHFTLGLRLAM